MITESIDLTKGRWFSSHHKPNNKNNPYNKMRGIPWNTSHQKRMNGRKTFSKPVVNGRYLRYTKPSFDTINSSTNYTISLYNDDSSLSIYDTLGNFISKSDIYKTSSIVSASNNIAKTTTYKCPKCDKLHIAYNTSDKVCSNCKKNEHKRFKTFSECMRNRRRNNVMIRCNKSISFKHFNDVFDVYQQKPLTVRGKSKNIIYKNNEWIIKRQRGYRWQPLGRINQPYDQVFNTDNWRSWLKGVYQQAQINNNTINSIINDVESIQRVNSWRTLNSFITFNWTNFI